MSSSSGSTSSSSSSSSSITQRSKEEEEEEAYDTTVVKQVTRTVKGPTVEVKETVWVTPTPTAGAKENPLRLLKGRTCVWTAWKKGINELKFVNR